MLTGEPNLAAYDPAGSMTTSSLRPAVGPLSGRNSRFRKLAGLTNPAMPIFGPARVTRTAKSDKRLRTQSRSGRCARVGRIEVEKLSTRWSSIARRSCGRCSKRKTSLRAYRLPISPRLAQKIWARGCMWTLRWWIVPCT